MPGPRWPERFVVTYIEKIERQQRRVVEPFTRGLSANSPKSRYSQQEGGNATYGVCYSTPIDGADLDHHAASNCQAWSSAIFSWPVTAAEINEERYSRRREMCAWTFALIAPISDERILMNFAICRCSSNGGTAIFMSPTCDADTEGTAPGFTSQSSGIRLRANCANNPSISNKFGQKAIILLSRQLGTPSTRTLCNKRAAPTFAKTRVPGSNMFALSFFAVSLEMELSVAINGVSKSSACKSLTLKNGISPSVFPWKSIGNPAPPVNAPMRFHAMTRQ
ncbi:hypothetical protein GALL_526850 [mine drainage metagenome]|uniref:Uncharacterized protein n=1 Tax=mine drainage metagenome TaxID=410659 RepID=A0A1J5P2G3_9ZZZZ